MNVRLVSIGRDGVLRVSLEGDVTADQLRPDGPHPFAGALGETWATNRVALSLKETPYLDSSGIGWLLSTHRAFKEAGGFLALHSPSAQVRQLFDLLQLHRALAIAPGEAEAVALALAQPEVPA